MSGLIDFLTTEEMIVVYALVGIASVLYFIIYFLDKTYYKRKQRQNTRELRKIVDEIAPEENVSVQQEPVIVPMEQEKEVTPLDEVALASVMPEVILPEVKEEVVTPVDTTLVVSEPSIKEEVVDTIEEVNTLGNSNVVEVLEENKEMDIQDNSVSSQEELQYTSIEPNPSEAQAELMKLTETLEKAEAEVKNIELTAFEEEQEQNAIISLDELMTRGKAMYESGELEKLEDEGNEPISLQDLEERMKEAKATVEAISEEPVVVSSETIAEQMVLDDFQTAATPKEVSPIMEEKKEESAPYQAHKKFKSSPVISPVYGIERPSDVSHNDIELENTANFEKLDEEIRKTNEFLMTLKELQKNLD